VAAEAHAAATASAIVAESLGGFPTRGDMRSVSHATLPEVESTRTIMSGSVGSDRRLEYAAVGDATNTASRLQSLSKQSAHQLFIAQSTRDKLGDTDGLVRLGSMQLSGRTEPCVVWTLPSG
jgi:hypothetical protein